MSGVVQVADIDLAIYPNDSLSSSNGQHRAQSGSKSVRKADAK